MAQLCHRGPKPWPMSLNTLGLEDIKHIIKQFGEAARRAREAGCDGIELHAAHAYMLLGSSITALLNKRMDAYGGSIENRIKLILEVIKSIRDQEGPDFPIIIRISADELVPGGRDLRETQYIAPLLIEAGVSAFNLSAGVSGDPRTGPPTGLPVVLMSGFSKAIKEVVDVPVMVVGRINDPG